VLGAMVAAPLGMHDSIPSSNARREDVFRERIRRVVLSVSGWDWVIARGRDIGGGCGWK
jgi:hypothetical protein